MRVKLIPVSVTESQKKLRIDDLNFVDEDVFIMETKKEGAYVFKQLDKDNDEEEKKSSSYSSYNSNSTYSSYNRTGYSSSSSRYGREEEKKDPDPPAMEVSNVGPFDMADLQAQSLTGLLNSRTNQGLCGL